MTSNVMWYNIYATQIISLLCYGMFVGSGLAHMLLSWKVLPVPSLDDIVPSWPVSVSVLVAAHFFHSWNCTNFVSARSLLVVTFALVLMFEEIGLRWGWLFSPYEFTSQLGWRLTDRLPALVLILWSCLVYPAMLLSNAILRGNPFAFPAKKSIIGSAVLVGVLLTGFDIVSEPVQVKWGYHLWSHMLQQNATCESYTSKPDWIFASGLSSYFEVPIQNFVGWFVSATCISCANYYLLLKHNGGRPITRAATVWHWLPIVAAIHCVMFYYILHACHPVLVRVGAVLYIVLTVAAAFVAIGDANKHRTC